MFILHNAIYRPIALSPQDKAKKREIQLQEKFEESREEYDGMWSDVTARGIIDNILDGVGEGMLADREGKTRVIDPDNLESMSEEQSDHLRDLITEHFEETYSDEDIQKRAMDHLDPDLFNRYQGALKAYDKAGATFGPDSEETELLHEELLEVEEEVLDAVETNEGDAWYEAKEALDAEHEEEYLNTAINQNYMTADKLRSFLEQRYYHLAELAESGGDIWRGVVMEAKKDPTTNRGLGEYWTDREDLARPFLKEMNRMEGWHDPVVIRYRARLDDLDDLNLQETLEANAWAFANDGYETDQHEVRFLKYAPIYVHSAELLDTDPHSPDYGASVIKTFPIEEMRRA